MDLAKAVSTKPDLAKRAKTQLNIGVFTSRGVFMSKGREQKNGG